MRRAMIAKYDERSVAHECYGHLGGRLSALMMAQFIDRGWLRLKEGRKTVYQLTEKGYRGLAEWGIDVSQLRIRKKNHDKRL